MIPGEYPKGDCAARHRPTKDCRQPTVVHRVPRPDSLGQNALLGYQGTHKGGSAIEAVLPLVET
jgi:hypothetical protein